MFDNWYLRLPRYVYIDELLARRQILEVGCGFGKGAAFLAEHDAQHVVGIDEAAEAIQTAQSQFSRQNLEFRRADLNRLDFDNETFDLVAVPDAVYPLSKENFLKEVRRILRPTGHL